MNKIAFIVLMITVVLILPLLEKTVSAANTDTPG